MGNSQTGQFLTSLQDLLNQRKLKIDKKILLKFLDEVDRIAPWFLPTGSLMLRSWDKLGRDIVREAEKGSTKPGVRPLWRLVRACLEVRRCTDTVKAGQKILTEHQESMSEEDREPRECKKKEG